MKNYKPASKIPELKLKSWKDIGDDVANQIRHLVQDKKVLGGSYSKEYAELKASKKAAVRQASTSTKPDLTLTGKMMNSLRTMQHDKYGAKLGMLDIHDEKRKFNAAIGFDMLNSNILDSVENIVFKKVDKEFAANIRKWEKGQVHIKLGK